MLIQEAISASIRADTDTKKESEVQSVAAAAQNSFLVGKKPVGLNLINTGALPNWQIEAENEFKTNGQTRRSSNLTMVVAAEVMEVTSNGNLLIEGPKRVRVNREDSVITVRGTIRARDVTPGNTILSSKFANAEIELKGQGPLWNNQRRGFFTKALDWFSPF